MSQRLILFAKRPLLGAVKTRLVPPLLPEQALELYEALLEDQIRFLRSFGTAARRVELCTDEPWLPRGRLARTTEGLPRSEQGPADLGARMLRAVSRSRDEGTHSTVIIGADAPTLPRDHVMEAFRALHEESEAVVSPAEDGGYVLIGMVRPLAELFREVSWGGASVMEVTRRRARQAGIRLHELPPWYDVDNKESLGRLRRDLQTPEGRRRAPATCRYLDRSGGR